MYMLKLTRVYCIIYCNMHVPPLQYRALFYSIAYVDLRMCTPMCRASLVFSSPLPEQNTRCVHEHICIQTYLRYAFRDQEKWSKRDEFNTAMNDIFKMWKEPTDENFAHQHGKFISKADSAVIVERFLKRPPTPDEMDRFWLEKEFQIGNEPVKGLVIPLG